MGIRDKISQLRLSCESAEGRDRVAAAAQVLVTGGALALHIGSSILRDIWVREGQEQEHGPLLPDEDLVTPEDQLHPDYDHDAAR